MKLNELFDKSPGYLVQSDSANLFKTTTNIGGNLYVFVASLDYGNTWGVHKEFWNVEFYEQDAGSRKYGKTGKGNELQVFSFVKDSFQEFLSRYAPEAIAFTAQKESGDSNNNRANLYSRMIKRLFKDWDIYLINHDDAVFFRISKPEID